jgi:hypothetical protein
MCYGKPEELLAKLLEAPWTQQKRWSSLFPI